MYLSLGLLVVNSTRRKFASLAVEILLHLRAKMHLPIRDDRNILSQLLELHCFFPVSDLCPARLRIGVLFESSQFSTKELKIDLL